MSAALLVADPEPSVATFLERHLTDDGFDVVRAVEGDEALELAERARPDLVLLAELDVCRRLREGEPGRSWDRDVPVIVLGRAQADAVDRVRAFARGCDDYLAKPLPALFAASSSGIRRSNGQSSSTPSTTSPRSTGSSQYSSKASP